MNYDFFPLHYHFLVQHCIDNIWFGNVPLPGQKKKVASEFFVKVEHDTLFASNRNLEKIQAPDGIQAHKPPWSSQML